MTVILLILKMVTILNNIASRLIVLVRVTMGKKKPATPVFDPVKFGSHLREKRRTLGFSNTGVLSDAIKADTGVYIDFDTLHKIERGEREPDVSKLAAICFTLGKRYGTGSDMLMLEDLMTAAKPLDFYFIEDGYEDERSFIAEFRERFRKDPSFDQVCEAMGYDNLPEDSTENETPLPQRIENARVVFQSCGVFNSEGKKLIFEDQIPLSNRCSCVYSSNDLISQGERFHVAVLHHGERLEGETFAKVGEFYICR